MKYIFKDTRLKTDIPTWKQSWDILHNVNDLLNDSLQEGVVDDDTEPLMTIIHYLSLIMEKIEQEHPFTFDDEIDGGTF